MGAPRYILLMEHKALRELIEGLRRQTTRTFASIRTLRPPQPDGFTFRPRLCPWRPWRLNQGAPKTLSNGLRRLLKRHSTSRLPRETKDAQGHKPLKAYDLELLHVEVKYLPQMTDETARRYLFVSIDSDPLGRLYPD